jgi:hypothetical protein
MDKYWSENHHQASLNNVDDEQRHLRPVDDSWFFPQPIGCSRYIESA